MFLKLRDPVLAQVSLSLAVNIKEQGRRRQISVGLADQNFPYYDIMLNHRVGIISAILEFS